MLAYPEISAIDDANNVDQGYPSSYLCMLSSHSKLTIYWESMLWLIPTASWSGHHKVRVMSRYWSRPCPSIIWERWRYATKIKMSAEKERLGSISLHFQWQAVRDLLDQLKASASWRSSDTQYCSTRSFQHLTTLDEAHRHLEKTRHTERFSKIGVCGCSKVGREDTYIASSKPTLSLPKIHIICCETTTRYVPFTPTLTALLHS
jgi:hypothetical protein